MKTGERTFVEISIPNILYNISELKKLLGKNVKFMAVVKADAYGHGAVPVSKAIEKKIDHLAVATLSEAEELKSAGIKKPILILGESQQSAAKEVVRGGFIQTVYTLELAKALSRAAFSLKKRARIHLKIDTGMGRVGAHYKEAGELLKKISDLPNIELEGIFTHFAGAEEMDEFTSEQLKRFRSFVSKIDAAGYILHAANSAAAICRRESHLDMVRVGLSMYGIHPGEKSRRKIKLRPALQFKTHVIYVKKVPAGTPLSYGSTYVTKKSATIATLPVGYADGLPRALSNNGEVLIRGKRHHIVGRVCMDMTLVDIGNSNVKAGDEVVLIGKQGEGSITADDVAKRADTISYEIICGIGKRVPRVYIR